MTVRRRVSFALATVLIAGLVVPAVADARIVTRGDRAGRTITFDVRAADVDVDWYATVLRNSAHGREISSVTFRIEPWRRLVRTCRAVAGGCYRMRGGRGLVVVPAGEGIGIAHTLLHEYAHHLDRARSVAGVREPNGTPRWWRTRGMSELLAQRRVRFDYSRGWTRSIGEIFAEDYARVHLELPTAIRWLGAPGRAVRAALFRDLGAVPVRPVVPPLVILRSGTLQPGASRSVPFGLLGPGRRVTFVAAADGAEAPGVRGRLELRCGARSVVRNLVPGRRSATIDQRRLGPARCRVVLSSASTVALRYTIRLRLAIERL